MRRIDALTSLNAFLFVDRTAKGGGPIVAVKDNIDVRGMPTTAGGRHLPTGPRAKDAECVRLLRRGGCVILGKTGLYEYAAGGTSQNPHDGDVTNPRAPDRDAGGSSSGSAAAVAAGICDAALGTDTLGSVRLPAAFCGVVGYKPPRAAISRRGVFPNSPTLDAVGVLAPDVRTAARVAGLMARRPPVRARPGAGRHRLAVPWRWLDGLDDEVREAFASVAAGLPDIDLPSRELLCEVALTVAQVEGLRVHRAWLRSAPERYGDEVRAQLEGSRGIRRSAYLAARRQLSLLRALMRRRLAVVDAILLPTVPFVPPPRGRYPPAAQRRLTDLTRPFNVSDSAVLSIPIPGTPLPMGLQIAANDAASAISVALAFERRLAVRT